MRIRVLLADDQPTIRQGLRLRLALEPDIQVVGEAANGMDAVSLARSLSPDVVVMDVAMPVLDGIGAARELRDAAPASAVVILSLHDDATTRDRARAAGVASFVAKHEAGHQLIGAIRGAAGAGQQGGRDP